MAWFDLLTSALGQQDPHQEFDDLADAQQAQNRAALGLDANGNPLPAGQPAAPAGAQSNQAAQSAAAGQAAASGVLQPNQEPQATKTPKSLGHVMMDLQQYQEREQGFNQSLGMGFAAFAQPRDREMVSKMFNVNMPDPLKVGQSQLDWAGQQQGQDRTNAIGQMIQGPQGAQIAQSMGMSIQQLKAAYLANPASIGQMVQNYNAPTEASKNYNQARALMKQQGMTDAQINAVMPPEMLALGVSDPGYREFVLARTRAIQSGGALPPELQDYPTYQASKAALAKTTTDIAQDKVNAAQALPGLNTQLTGVESNIQSVLNNPRLPNVLGKWTPTTGLGSTLFQDPQDIALAQQIQRLYSQMYSEGFKMGGGARKTQQELGMLGQAAGDTLNATYLSPDAFKAGLVRILDQTRATHANAYGATGNVSEMPSQYSGYLDPSYRLGGPFAAKGAPGALKPLSADDQKQLPDMIAKNGREAVISHLREQGYDTSGL